VSPELFAPTEAERNKKREEEENEEEEEERKRKLSKCVVHMNLPHFYQVAKVPHQEEEEEEEEEENFLTGNTNRRAKPVLQRNYVELTVSAIIRKCSEVRTKLRNPTRMSKLFDQPRMDFVKLNYSFNNSVKLVKYSVI